MERRMHELLSGLSAGEVPAGLRDRILARIALARRRRAYLRGVGAGAVALGSTVGFIATVRYSIDELYLSGFADYAQLLVSNFPLAGAAWQQFAFSLIESIPIVSIATAIAAGALTIWSLSRTIYRIGSVRGRTLAA